jgi:hypothetical protein
VDNLKLSPFILEKKQILKINYLSFHLKELKKMRKLNPVWKEGKQRAKTRNQ